jgi:hypothetical protein
MKFGTSRRGYLPILGTFVISTLLVLGGSAARTEYGWVAGDFHQHSTYTDGSNPIATVMDKNNEFGLDWWANSEHGGAFPRDGYGPILVNGFDTGEYARTWKDDYPPGTILGAPGLTSMWRWQSLRDYSFDDVLAARQRYGKPILQSLEWNVPGHEHCSMGIIANQFTGDPSAAAVAQFEYLFDGRDTDMDPNGGLSQGWTGKNNTNNHAKAVQALDWLRANYPRTSYVVFAHPERKGKGDPTYVGSGSKGYDIRDFRDFNNAAPDVAFGFESMPGHQKDPNRGGYSSTAFGGTLGGVGVYAAKVGGLWDAMLGEGRRWWLFASSDFHDTREDFWPGEYQKTHTYVADRRSPQAIVDGLRSGNSFVVTGDLITALEFSAQYGSEKATMGQTLPVVPKQGTGNPVKITIKFKTPACNNNNDPVAVDHIDLIAGEVTGRVAPGSSGYNDATNPTAKVMATLKAGDWKDEGNGWHVLQYHVRVDKDMYFRLRGTNLAPNTPNETDADGNPLADALMGPNTAAKAWADLWFYSNPIYVRVQR